MYNYVVVTERGGTHLCKTWREADIMVKQFILMDVHADVYQRI